MSPSLYASDGTGCDNETAVIVVFKDIKGYEVSLSCCRLRFYKSFYFFKHPQFKPLATARQRKQFQPESDSEETQSNDDENAEEEAEDVAVDPDSVGGSTESTTNTSARAAAESIHETGGSSNSMIPEDDYKVTTAL